MATNDTQTYHAYLLRLWRDDEHTPWRASLQETQTGQRQLISFASVAQLIAFIEQKTHLPILTDITEPPQS